MMIKVKGENETMTKVRRMNKERSEDICLYVQGCIYCIQNNLPGPRNINRDKEENKKRMDQV